MHDNPHLDLRVFEKFAKSPENFRRDHSFPLGGQVWRSEAGDVEAPREAEQRRVPTQHKWHWYPYPQPTLLWTAEGKENARASDVLETMQTGGLSSRNEVPQIRQRDTVPPVAVHQRPVGGGTGVILRGILLSCASFGLSLLISRFVQRQRMDCPTLIKNSTVYATANQCSIRQPRQHLWIS